MDRYTLPIIIEKVEGSKWEHYEELGNLVMAWEAKSSVWVTLTHTSSPISVIHMNGFTWIDEHVINCFPSKQDQ